MRENEDLAYKLGVIEGRTGEISNRLNHIETHLRDFGTHLKDLEEKKVGKWEVRIWSIIVLTFVSSWSYILLHSIIPSI